MILPAADYKVWSDKWQEASTSIENRDDNIEAVATLIETNITLIGATAIEDKLQDKVGHLMGANCVTAEGVYIVLDAIGAGDDRETSRGQHTCLGLDWG